jgi:hypothetical protein
VVVVVQTCIGICAATLAIELGVSFHSSAGKSGSQLRRAFEKDLKEDLARASGWTREGHGGMPPANFVIKMVAAGSVIVDTEILANSGASSLEPWSVASMIHEQQFDANSLLRTGILTKHTTAVTLNQHPGLPGAERVSYAAQVRAQNAQDPGLRESLQSKPAAAEVTVMSDWAQSPQDAGFGSAGRQGMGGFLTPSAITMMGDFNGCDDGALVGSQGVSLSPSPDAQRKGRVQDRVLSPERPLYARIGLRQARPTHLTY